MLKVDSEPKSQDPNFVFKPDSEGQNHRTETLCFNADSEPKSQVREFVLKANSERKRQDRD